MGMDGRDLIFWWNAIMHARKEMKES